MDVQWSSRKVLDASLHRHFWAALSCPRCAGVTLLEFSMLNEVDSGNASIHPASEVAINRVTPSGDDAAQTVKHLPDDVKSFYDDAWRVLQAGVPDAAAVQLRKTLEAAAAHKGIQEKQLVASIRKLVDLGFVTLDFKDVLTHIRQIGNSGAHYTDVRLTKSEVERSLRFTTQVLRNLFEVPGELDELRQEAESEPIYSTSDPESDVAPDAMRI